ncbi:hypothetical protein CEXT_263321 [Caerostris extrusa]|uniref:Uncharacterized protein n=1 Tax=Caerostris extrusa TaxID=172846 RepID=A0AAV4XVN1_CAEEX|nr:hypothetical protein CEXT_263321 [Caerostris extrusa]
MNPSTAIQNPLSLKNFSKKVSKIMHKVNLIPPCEFIGTTRFPNQVKLRRPKTAARYQLKPQTHVPQRNTTPSFLGMVMNIDSG